MHSDFLTSLSSSLTELCLQLEDLCFKVTGKKDRELLTNKITIYTSSTYVKPYKNILEHF